MSNHNNKLVTENLAGSIVFGEIVKILQYGAILRLPNSIYLGYLHINQVSEKRIALPLEEFLKVGESIEVLVKWFDATHNTWETSHKAVIQRKRLHDSGLLNSEARISAEIMHADELGAIVNIEGVRICISGGADICDPYKWNAYNVLYSAGCITADSNIDVAVLLQGADKEIWPAGQFPKFRVVAGEPQRISRGSICDGQVILIRKNVIPKTHRMHDDLYVRLAGGEIAWLQISDVMAVEETFPLGATIPLVIEKYKQFRGMLDATIDWSRTTMAIPHEPEVGAVLDVKVIAVHVYGALCLIANRVKGILQHSTIIKEKGGDTRRHLHPGDVLRVIVAQRGERGFLLEFVQLLDRIFEPEITESANLVDLRVVRRTGSASGFRRSQDFRLNVLDAFDHTCCVCGDRYVFGRASAMEAAHIIPKARRGADTTRNSLCLCSLHHWALDRGFITIDENFRVVVARQIVDLGAAGTPISRHHGNKIHVQDTTMISTEAIQWHRENVFLDELRFVDTQ